MSQVIKKICPRCGETVSGDVISHYACQAIARETEEKIAEVFASIVRVTETMNVDGENLENQLLLMVAILNSVTQNYPLNMIGPFSGEEEDDTEEIRIFQPGSREKNILAHPIYIITRIVTDGDWALLKHRGEEGRYEVLGLASDKD